MHQAGSHGAGVVAESFTSDPKAGARQRARQCLVRAFETLKPCTVIPPPTWLYFLILTKHCQQLEQAFKHDPLQAILT